MAQSPDQIWQRPQPHWLSWATTISWSRVSTHCLLWLLASVYYVYFDRSLSLIVHSALADTTLHNLLNWVTWFGESQWYLVPTAFAYVWYRRTRPLLALQAQFLFVAIAGTGIAVNIIKILLPRYRPLLLFSENLFGFTGTILEFSPSHLSFPSGHTVTVFSLSVSLAILRPKYRWHFMIFASMIALSRILVTAHYPSDVMIGAWLGVVMTQFIYRRYYSERIPC